MKACFAWAIFSIIRSVYHEIEKSQPGFRLWVDRCIYRPGQMFSALFFARLMGKQRFERIYNSLVSMWPKCYVNSTLEMNGRNAHRERERESFVLVICTNLSGLFTIRHYAAILRPVNRSHFLLSLSIFPRFAPPPSSATTVCSRSRSPSNPFNFHGFP